MKEVFKRFCESLKNQDEVNIIRDTKAVAVGISNFKTNNKKAYELAKKDLILTAKIVNLISKNLYLNYV